MGQQTQVPKRKSSSAKFILQQIWSIYIIIGTVLGFPVLLSYWIATPFLEWKLFTHGAPLPQLAVAGFSMFFMGGFLGAVFKILLWPWAIYVLLAGQEPSFWHWLVPGFFYQPTFG